MTGFSSEAAAARGASSLEKMLGLLDLFTTRAPAWSTEELIRVSGTSRSTCYRYIKALQAAGLVTPVAGGAWMLGPRIIELDRTMRLCDPVTAGGTPPMRRLAAETGHSGLLCLLFSGTVMCVGDAPAQGAPEGIFARGQRRPLFTGAASKVILAHLPPHQLRAIHARHRGTIAAAGLGADWESFRHALRQIREAGHCVTQSEFQPGVVGIAAPLFNAEGGVLGSLGLAAVAEGVPPAARAGLARQVMQAAKEACDRIADQEQLAALPARAVG
ncbi:IclR family transcriptional regulator [Falsiroseomonas selenitidurans]|uniref:IclR family transcriptional regulator n=1 Tax=Falsiroseomonas selenitidurans TaxID=2716335 RepID=A0ABX1DXI9_9PROT|nr:IclR family transcriptional regulator [Falsiroseomonas selenitidurans]NKC29506.1 IclR family transcriptional regulator [Falsiroseomonas selenitidurans]